MCFLFTMLFYKSIEISSGFGAGLMGAFGVATLLDVGGFFLAMALARASLSFFLESR
jgi:hypothetical protein